MDQIYRVNVDTLGVNGLIQNIDLLSENGHYDHEKFSWHARMVDFQCKKLELLIPNMKAENIIHLIIALARIPTVPTTELINVCLKTITKEQFALRVFQWCLDDDYYDNFAKQGPQFLEEDDPTSQFLCQYLYKSSILISGDAIRKQFEAISKTVLTSSMIRVTKFPRETEVLGREIIPCEKGTG